jgi:hypothetical protein
VELGVEVLQQRQLVGQHDAGDAGLLGWDRDWAA